MDDIDFLAGLDKVVSEISDEAQTAGGGSCSDADAGIRIKDGVGLVDKLCEFLQCLGGCDGVHDSVLWNVSSADFEVLT